MRDNLRIWNFFIINFLLILNNENVTATVVLQQTVPPEGVAVCPLSTVQYTCVADTSMTWRESGSSVISAYTILPPASRVNDTAMAGSFRTVLTDISGTTLTSTATIDSVNLVENGSNISCHGITKTINKLILVQGAPSPPNNQAANLLSTEGDDAIVQLTWSQDNSHCVVKYHIEVTSDNNLISMTTTSQHITLTLQIGVVYSFRVRGADTINRLGQWSGSFPYIYHLPAAGLSGGVIAVIVIVPLVGIMVAIVLVCVIIYYCKSRLRRISYQEFNGDNEPDQN